VDASAGMNGQGDGDGGSDGLRSVREPTCLPACPLALLPACLQFNTSDLYGPYTGEVLGGWACGCWASGELASGLTPPG